MASGVRSFTRRGPKKSGLLSDNISSRAITVCKSHGIDLLYIADYNRRNFHSGGAYARSIENLRLRGWSVPNVAAVFGESGKRCGSRRWPGRIRVTYADWLSLSA